MSSSPCYVVAVHIGAGYHSRQRESLYRSVIKEACLAAGKLLSQVPMLFLISCHFLLLTPLSIVTYKYYHQGGDAVAGVSEAIKYLENSSCTNAGIIAESPCSFMTSERVSLRNVRRCGVKSNL